MADFRKVVRHKRTKSVIETRLYYQILAKFEYAKRSGSNNAHATDIYYPERENYIPRKREWLLLIHLRGQCEKPDSVDEQDTVLTLFAFNNLAVPTGDEGHKYCNMGLFGFSKKYTKEDLQREIHALAALFRQANGVDSTTKSKNQLKQELAVQLHQVLDIIKKGDFAEYETVEWNPGLPRTGNYTSLRNVAPMVQVFIELM